MPVSSRAYNQNVFINCPFDSSYRPILNAIIFTVQFAGLRPRCALEASNAATFRLQKIIRIISECKYGIHDISRTELGKSGLPRFNMPLELGLDLGASNYGTGRLNAKTLLVLDKRPFRYQEFISDISGQDIYAHYRRVNTAIAIVRDWLASESGITSLSGGAYIYSRYLSFNRQLPRLCLQMKRKPAELTFGDFTLIVRLWFEENEQ